MRIWKTCSLASKARRMAAALALLLLAAALFSLNVGASRIPLAQAMGDALRGEDTAAARILLHIRLPRTLAAILCGAALAVAGVVIQGVLGNPLAGPNIIGVNAGAGLTTLLAAAFFPAATALLPAASFLGALGAALLILFLADRLGASRMTVVLSGVAISAMLSAGSDLIITLDPEAALGMSAFRMGGLSGVTLERLVSAAWYILPGLALAWLTAGELDLLALGDESAQSVGLRVKRARVLLLALASVLAGAAVSFAGLVGFVGLIVPHMARLLVGGEHKLLVPLSLEGGALLVLLCDTAARTLFAPYELPVGILLAMLGGPFFLALLVRGRKGGAL